MSEPHQPPRPPEFTPGQATPPPYEPAPEYPPTSQFPPVNYAPPGYTPDYGQPQPGYPPPGYGDQSQPGYLPPPYPDHHGYGAPPPPPRRSNKPLIAVIVAVSLLLCGGVITSGVLLVQRATQEVQEATDEAREAVDPYINPSLPTDFPSLPTDLPAVPGLGEGAEISVTYEVTGDGPANIIYTEQLGSTPKVVENVDLPWKVSIKMKGASFVSVTASRTTGDAGSISCSATVDKDEVATQKAEGGWATTTCNKLVFK